MEFTLILCVAALFLVYSLFSRRLSSTPITAPIIFVIAGILVGINNQGVLGDEMQANRYVQLLAEFTLIFVLFTDASMVDWTALKKELQLPLRMLSVGLPLTFLLGTGLAFLFFGSKLGFTGCFLLAAILTPTDAALGQAIVTNSKVPKEIRQGISVESGLNDGICLPLVIVLAAIAGNTGEGNALAWFTLAQVVLGPIVGVAVGFAGAKAIDVAVDKDFISKAFEGIAALAVAIVCYSIAESVHGNGFIAVFIGGIVFGQTLKHRCDFLYEFAESEGQFFTLSTFFVFGIVACELLGGSFNPVYIAFGFLILTFARMIPVMLSLTGTKTTLFEKLILGWFGPRGLASILFAFLILERENVPNKDILVPIVITVVLLSVVLHGVTAAPLANRFSTNADQ